MTETSSDSPERLSAIEIPLAGDLLLRQIAPEDSQAMFDLIDRNRDHLSQHGDDTSENYPTLESVIKRNESQSDDELRFGIWDESIDPSRPLVDRFKPRLAGFIKLTQKPDVPIEIGYYLDAAQQHRGVMEQCVGAVTRLALDGLGKNVVMAKVSLTNSPSLKVLQKAGYKVVDQDEENYTLEYEEKQSVPVFFSEVADPKYMSSEDYEKIETELLEASASLGYEEGDVLFSGQSRLGQERRGRSTHFGGRTALTVKWPDSLHGNPITFALMGLYGVVSIYDKSKLQLDDSSSYDHGIWVDTWVLNGNQEKADEAKIAELRLANRLDLPLLS